ncbi:MAG: hypothetical protein MJ245_05405 [Clostridia bacterium]|nr:hypothetical protein [Clostridia bacterium]
MCNTRSKKEVIDGILYDDGYPVGKAKEVEDDSYSDDGCAGAKKKDKKKSDDK